MERAALLEQVSDRTGADEESADDVVRAVLETLGERLSGDEAEDLAVQVPGLLSQHFPESDSGLRFSEEELVARVDRRMDTDDVPGQEAATTVLGAFLEMVDEPDRAAVVDQLRHYGFEELLRRDECGRRRWGSDAEGVLIAVHSPVDSAIGGCVRSRAPRRT
ncbi:DUF2267 domain-containing protein [Natrinema halophilum]|uniref:DUF2267 domain-containing protein n=1 Tax=Natrinema halophilum TaxID=1699371 RepID=UPI001F1C4451|nr:DUF2267 domain-containing protein [Natrinema halophilum]UHQ95988.1 DUF2267 domain-containing protein [Natrinema halophilum]